TMRKGPTMATDPIDDLLRADEEVLKAKRARLRAFARSVETAREAISAAQDSAKAIASSDGLSRADIARTFELSPAERAVLLPTRRRRSSGDSAVPDEADKSHDADAGPDDGLSGQAAQGDDTAKQQEEQAHDERESQRDGGTH